MSLEKPITLRPFAALLALSLGAAAPAGRAQSPVAAGGDAGASALSSQSMTTSLVARLTQRGVLSKQDSAELMLLAEADAADARAQNAMLQAALAQAAAAQARSRALAAMLAHRMGGSVPTESVASLPVAPEPPLTVPMPPPEPLPALPSQPALGDQSPISVTLPEEAPVSVAALPAPRLAAVAQPDPLSEPEPAPPAPVRRIVAAAAPAAADSAPAAEPVADDVVRVTYVPEVVKAQLREEIKQDVMAQARQENWAAPRTFPDWVSRIQIFGDVRVRYESIRFPTGNDNTGAFPNFNAINTGAPYDVSGTLFSPQYDVDQDRTRLRLRARAGLTADLGEGFTAGLRVGTGENNSPVTANQSLGAAGSGQGGDFSRYGLWLDRGFLRYETGGLPDEDLTVSAGRFDNPFMATSLIWADDLGFDGLVVQGRAPGSEDLTFFSTAGAFPIFNTDLNFATNQPAKFKSDDKWLYAAQVGVTWEVADKVSLKVAGAYYRFQNIEGKLSSPFTPLTSADAGDTDASRPSFAQKGNTYMALRDIVANANNANGTANQFQYFGLASKFNVMAFDTRLDFNQFEPFQISIVGEYAKNLAFDSAAIAAKAVNNLGVADDTTTPGPFLGGNTAWMTTLVVGDAALAKRWDWNVSLGYRYVASDAVVDGFNDADFGLGGTNVKGITFGGNLALSSRVWIGLKWMSAAQVAGPTLKSDVFQFDLNGKF